MVFLEKNGRAVAWETWKKYLPATLKKNYARASTSPIFFIVNAEKILTAKVTPKNALRTEEGGETLLLWDKESLTMSPNLWRARCLKELGLTPCA